MTLHLDWVAALLEAEGHGTLTEDIFIGSIPAELDNAIMLRDPLTGHEVNEEIPNWYNTNFQVIVRDEDEAQGAARAEAIFKMLFQNHVETPELTVVKMFPRTKPVMYPRNDADHIEFSMLVRIHFGEK